MALFNLAGAVAGMGNAKVTVRRPAPDTYDANGRAAVRVYSVIASGKASVQPVKGQDIEKLPEGENLTEWQTIYFSHALIAGDLIDVTGKGTFQVRTLNDWMDTGAFSKVFMKKMNPQEPRP